MAGDTDTRSEKFKEFSGQFYQRLVEGVAGVYGGKAANAVGLTPDQELERWLQPTSPAAVRARELGGSPEDAEAANRLWAHAMKGEQLKIREQMLQAGAPPAAIEQALVQQGISDDAIFATCRKYAHELGRTNGHNKPKEIVAYHQKMAEKAMARRAPAMTYADVAGEETEHAAVGIAAEPASGTA